MTKQYYVYVITNSKNTVLYTGVTGNLLRRISQHREHKIEGFSKRYKLFKLVYYEATPDVSGALEEEKRIKHLKRIQKEKLVNDFNPEWKDLYDNLF